MALTVRHMCEIIHELCPSMGISVQGLVDGKPVYAYPDCDGVIGDQEASRVELHSAERMGYTSATVSFDSDKTYYKKEEKMSKEQSKEPIKLLTMLAYVRGDEGDDVWLEVRLETRDEHGSGCFLFVEGFAEALKSQPGIFENYYVERILYREPEEGERHLLIQAVKEE